MRSLFSLKVLIGATLFALSIFGVLAAVLWSARAENNTQTAFTAILNIIVAPTATPPRPAATITPTPEPTRAQGVPTPGGDINIGDYVQVGGTQGDGLRLHETPGVATGVRYVAIDSEVFLVKDGPIDAEGYTWWLLQDPFTETIAGWGVSNYLSQVQNPN
jgi:hypothetical protein